MAIKKAGLKAKLVTGTYVLQSNRTKFNLYSVDPTRLLCVDDTKDMIHFLLINIVNSVVKYCVVCEYISTKHAIVSGISFMKIYEGHFLCS